MAYIKRFFVAKLAKHLFAKATKQAQCALADQERTLKQIVKGAQSTAFGRDHHFDQIDSYLAYKQRVPVRDYEALRPYLERVAAGEPNVCWPGRPLYLCKTSGTTSGAKFIPITKASVKNHIHGARDALFTYAHLTQSYQMFDGKMIFVQGNPTLEQTAEGIHTGRLSGIAAHFVPKYLQRNRLPSWDINCIDDWETKIHAIAQETIQHDMTLISGIPPWLVMYFEALNKIDPRPIGEIFPNLKLIITGGVNFEPYRSTFDRLIGRAVDQLDLYPASEGFVAYQDLRDDSSMILQTNKGIFYEFIPLSEFHDENPTRLSLKEVQTGIDYAIIINSNAGLWGYSLGDTVRFTSTSPYRLKVTGRVAHFTSAFGEHVIAKEVEEAMAHAIQQTGIKVKEFTVAPMINPPEGELPYHQWFVELDGEPVDVTEFARVLDVEMTRQNTYYNDLISGQILQPLKITLVQPNGFNAYMDSIGKLGEQNKPPRLKNDRSMADKLQAYAL